MTANTNSEEPDNNEQTDINQPATVDNQLKQVLEVLTNHLDEVAGVLARLRDEKYGKFTANIDGVKWTLKHENGSVEWFRRSVDSNDQYIISTKQKPSPSTVAEGMDGYPQFIEEFNRWVDELAEGLQPAEDELSEVEALLDQLDVESLLDRRDALERDAWNVASHVGNAISQTTGNEYGTFKATVDGDSWKLKYQDGGSAKYLQIGNTYVLGRDSAHPEDLAHMVRHFDSWIESVNSWLADQDEMLRLSVEITETDADPAENNS